MKPKLSTKSFDRERFNIVGLVKQAIEKEGAKQIVEFQVKLSEKTNDVGLAEVVREYVDISHSEALSLVQEYISSGDFDGDRRTEEV